VRVGIHIGQLRQAVTGGIGRYIEELLGALPTTDAELVTFASGNGETKASWPNFVELGRPGPPLRYDLWHRLRRPPLPIDVDVVHAPSLAVPPHRDAGLVVTVHDLAFLRVPGTLTKRGVRFHRRGLTLARKEAGAIVVPSTFVRDELLAEDFDATRIVVAPHGAPTPTARHDDDVDAAVHAAGIETPFVLFVGTVEPRKGLDTLIDGHRLVRATHPDLNLVVAGPSGWGDEITGASGVHLLGHVDDDTLDALYRRAALCALPSRYEGFGLPALEAMSRGAPVIVSDIPPLVEVTGDAAVRVSVDDVNAWAAAIKDLLDDATRRSDLGAQGRGRAGSFTWEASAHAHLLAYELARKTAS